MPIEDLSSSKIERTKFKVRGYVTADFTNSLKYFLSRPLNLASSFN